MPCDWTKEFLSRNGIAHIVKDVEADPTALEELLAYGFRTTPVTVIDGATVKGFDQERLTELLAL